MTEKIFGRLSLCLAIFALCFTITPGNAASNDVRDTAASGSSRFDFYVLSLSWSPSYCAAAGEKANRYQCGKRPAYGFVVHGLWPQYEHGYPKDCRSDAERRVPKERMNALSDLMPGYGLIIHEWRTHGMCTGLSQEAYFATLRKAYESVEIPADFPRDDSGRVKPSDIEAAFIAANPGMPDDGISVDCDRKYLREVRVCMTKDMRFRPCRELERASCHASNVQMPPS
ncbi:ribonuclease T2 family protein [Mesorhizobium koreense]|jgi:ribonuclease T2|uniref:ribonuclease T2 family protein n=1 Tax=Mesorhizobium koreense TaxID=3074855 RepID=UPI00287B78C8|nr:ribonuclease [Mesorhizobium sp. WR6]